MERRVDSTTGPVQAFAGELRTLRRRAGTPDYGAMGRETGISPQDLRDATAGHRLPPWDVVAAFVHACGGDVPVWRKRWELVRDAMRFRIPHPRRPR